MEEKFTTKKSLGQHFLNSAAIPREMCDAAGIKNGDRVVEIGPGTGMLTVELLRRGAEVIALEADRRAIKVLEEKFQNEIASSQLSIKHVDVRQFELETLGLKNHSFKVVANIPYYLSGFLFRSFLSCSLQPQCLVFLVQKEVGKRVTVKDGEKESLLSLSVKAFGEPAYIKSVGKGHFTPQPKVDSAIVLVQNINRDNFKNLDQKFFFELLHLGFGQKRKQLLGNLSAKWKREELIDMFSPLSMDAKCRAEDLPLKIWLELGRKLQNQQ